MYRKIIDWRNHLYFPDDVHLSREAEDLVRRMLCEADRRLTVEQLKAHPFFYGVDWSTIRNIDAPFVPHLRSMTDTSYFPTDELEQVPDVPHGADNGPSATKDLAFLGYTWVWAEAEALASAAIYGVQNANADNQVPPVRDALAWPSNSWLHVLTHSLMVDNGLIPLYA